MIWVEMVFKSGFIRHRLSGLSQAVDGPKVLPRYIGDSGNVTGTW